MIKIVLFLKKKAGLSRQEFIDYYENHHVPLIVKHTGHFMLAYKRSFIDWDDPLSAASADTFGASSGEAAFDVVTEILVKDRATMTAMFATASEAELAAIIAADEEKLFDRPSSRMLIADEYPR